MSMVVSQVTGMPLYDPEEIAARLRRVLAGKRASVRLDIYEAAYLLGLILRAEAERRKREVTPALSATLPTDPVPLTCAPLENAQ